LSPPIPFESTATERRADRVGSRILGTGMAVPAGRLTNELLARCMTVSPDWIFQRTGIRERRISPDTLRMLERLALAPDKPEYMRQVFEDGVDGRIDSTLTVTDLAFQAATQAIERAGMTPGDLDCIILSSTIPELAYPHPGCLLQGRLGAGSVPALCLQQGCAGFLFGLALAHQLIGGGLYERVLVVGAELVSSMFDYSDRGRESAILFGDGAGAAILARHAGDSSVVSSHLHSDGSKASVLYGEMFGSSTFPPVSKRKIEVDRARPRMDGRAVFAHAVRRLEEVVTECLEHNGLGVGDVQHYIFHQANLRIVDAVVRLLGLPESRVFNNIENYGNTGAASVPIALHEASAAGRILRGDVVLLAGFGTGFSWGAVLLRW
jgi:3-oxoacyl-[acyl-carrier-protein] synthase-3